MIDSMLKELSPDEAFKHIETITKNHPMRLAGSPGLKWMAEYARDVLVGYGVDATVHEFDGFLSFPGTSELKVLSPIQESIPSRAFAHIASTSPAGIEGELVFVGSGGEEDYKGKDVRGKITLSELSYEPPRQEKQRIAHAKGSIGQIMMNWGPSDNKTIAYGSVKQSWGNPVPDNIHEKSHIPSITISRSAGERLRDLCQKETVKVWLRADCIEGWMKTQITVGRIQGTVEPERFSIIGGHMDSWGGGVSCNATGNCAVLEVARVLSKYRSALGRSVVFALWSGHETGTMVGSTWFVDHFWEDLKKNGLIYINVDSPGLPGAEIYSANSSLELISFHKGVEAAIFAGEQTGRKALTRLGDQSFFGLGVPSIASRTHYSPEQIKAWNGATHGWWHHSDEMTMEYADKQSLLKSMKAYVGYLYHLSNTPIVPYDFLPVAEAFEKRINEVKAEARDIVDMSAVAKKSSEFKEAVMRMGMALEGMKERTKGVTDWNQDEKMKQLNSGILRLARILTPISSTLAGKYGQDLYGLTALKYFIPGLYVIKEMKKLDREADEYKVLYTQAVREKNKVLDALDEAVECIDETLKQLAC